MQPASGPASDCAGSVYDGSEYARLAADLGRAGLTARGGFEPAPGELPALGGASGSVVLVGAVGDSHWAAFSASPEYRDGAVDPLDRWSRRVVGAVAATWRARPLFPFEGPPFLPFQAWARRAEPVHASPLGLLVHPRYGLWHSYRAALLFARPLTGLPRREAAANPCASCAGRPCLSGCPVDAFGGGGYDSTCVAAYDTARCAGHLETPAGGRCLDEACLARAACPVGAAYRYPPAVARFHMGAFRRSLRAGRGR